MTKLCFIFIFLFGVIGVNAQTCTVPSGFVCITQFSADSIAKDLDELKLNRIALAKALAQVNLGDAERAAAQNLIKTMNDAFDARGRIVDDQTKMLALQQSVITMYADLVQKLTAEMNKKSTGFQKLVATVGKIALIVVGITIGRGL